MSSPIKAIVAGVAVAGIGGTGVWIIAKYKMPAYKTLDKDSGFAITTYQNKYAEKYTRFLVGVADPAQGQESKKGNSDWWDWSFRNNYKAKGAKQGFKDLKRGAKGQGNTDNKSLQEACESAYKTEVAKVKKEASNTDEFEEDQVWVLCSFNGKKPVTLSEANKDNSKDNKDLNDDGKWKGTNKWGTKHKEDLLAIHDPINAKIWNHLNKRFKEEANKTGFFSGGTKSLKDRCAEAYGKESSTTADNNNPSETDLYKWCSVKGSKTTAQ